MTRLVLFIAAIAVTACALQTRLSTGVAANLKGRRIATTPRLPPSFGPGGGLRPFEATGLPGYFAVMERGDRILHDNAITDPAQSIARQLSEDLCHRYGLRLAAGPVSMVDDDPAKISAADPSADLVLDVWTNDWGLVPAKDDESKYRVRYTVNLRLIDAKAVHLIDGKSGIVIAEGTCRRVPEEAPSAPTEDELLADGARRLKDELDAAARYCVDEFRSTILAVGSSR